MTAGIPVRADAGSLAAARVREMAAGRRSVPRVMRHAVHGEFVEEEMEEIRRRGSRGRSWRDDGVYQSVRAAVVGSCEVDMIGLIDRIAMWYWRRTLRTPENERRVQEFREYLRRKALEESTDGAAPEWDEEAVLDLYSTKTPGGRKS